MIIHQPEIVEDGDHTILWTHVEMEVERENFPDTLWYRVPKQYAQYLCQQTDGFLTPALLAGMHFGEDIEVRGAVSPRLAYQLEEYQFLLSLRMPEDVRPVKVTYEQLKPLDAVPTAVGTTFSGGVDSLFTIWQHLPQNLSISDYQITHALFIHGFDFLVGDKRKFAEQFERYQMVLEQINIELVPIQTNTVRIIIPRMKYRYFYGPILAGSGLAYGGLFKRLYIPSSRDYLLLRHRESSSGPVTDMLLSTDTLEFIHQGAIYQRVEKVQAISKWKLAQQNLRVCPHSVFRDDGLNCSRCEKCIRTMLVLYALGEMESFVTFVKPMKANWEILWWARKFNPARGYVGEIFQLARAHKPAMIPWLWLAAILGYIRFGLLKIIPKFIIIRLQSYGYFINPYEAEYAFDDPRIIQALRSKFS